MEKNDYVQQVESQHYAISLYGSETMEGEMVEFNKIIKKVWFHLGVVSRSVSHIKVKYLFIPSVQNSTGIL